MAGTVQWYNWDRTRFRPWGWSIGPSGARHNAMTENAKRCQSASTESCSGPFPFAIGPLLLLSVPLVRLYTSSAASKDALVDAISSRVNRSAVGGGSGGGSPSGGGEEESFLRPETMGDLDVRLFDDVFLGHELCMTNRAANVSVVAAAHVYTCLEQQKDVLAKVERLVE